MPNSKNNTVNKKSNCSNSEFRKDLIEALIEAEEMEKHPKNYKTYHSIEELIDDLHNEM